MKPPWLAAVLLGVAASLVAVNSVWAAPIVKVMPSEISRMGNTTLTVTVDPNGSKIAGVVLVFAVNPSEINLVAVTSMTGFSVSGMPGGINFSFGQIFGTDQTLPIVAGTVELQGLVGGAALILDAQYYTDENLMDTAILTDEVVATVALGPMSPSITPTQTQTPTPTATLGPCAGRCRGGSTATMADTVVLIHAALGDASVNDCMSGDANHDQQITIDEIVAAVDAATGGCP